MEPTDITIEILKDIRNEIHETGQEIDETRGRALSSHRRRRFRTSTAITEAAGTVHDLTEVLRASHDLRPRVERCERIPLKR